MSLPAAVLLSAGLWLSQSLPCVEHSALATETSESIYANKVLKRRLQTDRRMAVSEASEGGADVYASLPFAHLLQLHLILGRYQAFAQEGGDLKDLPVKAGDKSTADIEMEVSALKGGADQKRLAHTRMSAEQMIIGSAVNDVKVLDEFSAPPVMEGEGRILRKNKSSDAASIEAFDLARSGRMAQALRVLSTALAGGKETGSAQIRLSNNNICLLALNDDISGARAALKKALSENPQLADGEKYPITVLNQVALHLAAKDSAAALANLETLKDRPLSGRLGLCYWLGRVKAYQINGQAKEAQDTLDQMIKRYPNNILALTTAGDLAMEAGNYKLAADYFTPAASINKTDPAALIKLAQCQAKMGDLDSAINTATTAVNNCPNNAQAHIALGKLHMDNKEFLGARLQFERALELKPEFAIKRTAFTPLIKVLDIMNEDKELLRNLALWAKENPQEPVCHYNFAFVLAQKNQIAQAIIEYEKAIALTPGFTKARYNLALLYHQNKQTEEAKAQLRKLLLSTKVQAEKEQAEKLLRSFN